jgi:nucleoid-associated protein YgaU
MDTQDGPAEAQDQARTAEAEAAEEAAEREAAAAAARPAVAMEPVEQVAVAPRRGLFSRLLLLVVAILLVLAIGAGIGFGAATLLPGLTDASPPTATLPPPTERPTAPPIPTAAPSASPSPSPSPEPSPTPLVHTVKRGENLTQIAARYRTTVAAIVEANGLKNANLIETGQRLVIPTPSPAP